MLSQLTRIIHNRDHLFVVRPDHLKAAILLGCPPFCSFLSKPLRFPCPVTAAAARPGQEPVLAITLQTNTVRVLRVKDGGFLCEGEFKFAEPSNLFWLPNALIVAFPCSLRVLTRQARLTASPIKTADWVFNAIELNNFFACLSYKRVDFLADNSIVQTLLLKQQALTLFNAGEKRFGVAFRQKIQLFDSESLGALGWVQLAVPARAKVVVSSSGKLVYCSQQRQAVQLLVLGMQNLPQRMKVSQLECSLEKTVQDLYCLQEKDCEVTVYFCTRNDHYSKTLQRVCVQEVDVKQPGPVSSSFELLARQLERIKVNRPKTRIIQKQHEKQAGQAILQQALEKQDLPTPGQRNKSKNKKRRKGKKKGQPTECELQEHMQLKKAAFDHIKQWAQGRERPSQREMRQKARECQQKWLAQLIQDKKVEADRFISLYLKFKTKDFLQRMGVKVEGMLKGIGTDKIKSRLHQVTGVGVSSALKRFLLNDLCPEIQEELQVLLLEINKVFEKYEDLARLASPHRMLVRGLEEGRAVLEVSRSKELVAQMQRIERSSGYFGEEEELRQLEQRLQAQSELTLDYNLQIAAIIKSIFQ